MASEVYCLRCEGVKLIMLPESDKRRTFYRCPQCHRHFVQYLEYPLTERYPAFSWVLYSVMFDPTPQAHTDGVVAMLRDQFSVETLGEAVSAIRQELASPTQPVHEIFDLRVCEQDVREFLALVADKLSEEVQAFPLRRRLQGHSGWVRSLAMSADGQVLASGGSDQTVRLWDVRTGMLLQTLTEHSGAVLSVAISPDGRTVASGSADQTIRLWERRTGMLLQALPGHTGWVRSVAFSPDGTLLASGSADTTIRLWRVQTGQLLRVLRGHSHPVYSVAIRPDGKVLVSGSSGNTVGIWDLTTGQLLRTLQEHTKTILCLAFKAVSPHKYWLVSGSADTTIKQWDIEAPSGHVGSPHVPWHTTPAHAGAVRSLAFHPTRRILFSSGEDQMIKLWAPASGDLLRAFTAHAGPVYSMAISPDGKTLASCSQSIKLWHMR